MTACNEQQRGPMCPKRNRVLHHLVDDVDQQRLAGWPMWLELHLRQCDSCRALADHLTGVTATLADLCAAEPTADLLERARARTEAALADDATPTGRVPFDDDFIDLELPAQRSWRRYVPYLAVAASIVLAVSVLRPGVAPLEPAVTGAGYHVADPTPATDWVPEEFAPAGNEHLMGPAERLAVADPPAEAVQVDPSALPTAHSYFEAANLDTKHGFQRATILRYPAATQSPWQLLFDTPTDNRSTTASADEE